MFSLRRNDALCARAEMILKVNELPASSGASVGTVTQCTRGPGSDVASRQLGPIQPNER